MRLFVALELPARVRAALSEWSGALDDGVWRSVPEANLHVTLAFLGERPEEDVAVVDSVLRGIVGEPPLSLRCARVVALPPRRPRVVAVGLEEAGGDVLGALHGAVSAGLASAGVYQPDRRPFLPHVTVGRVRRGARGFVPAALAAPECAFSAESVTAFRSRPGRGGSVYEPLASVALG